MFIAAGTLAIVLRQENHVCRRQHDYDRLSVRRFMFVEPGAYKHEPAHGF